MKSPPDAIELNRIEKRAIEALAIAPVIMAVAQRIGLVWDFHVAAMSPLQEGLIPCFDLSGQKPSWRVPIIVISGITWEACKCAVGKFSKSFPRRRESRNTQHKSKTNSGFSFDFAQDREPVERPPSRE